MTHWNRRIAITLLLLCRAWPALADSVPETRLEGPRDGIRHASLRTIWEIPAETEDYLIGNISDVARDPDGNILCLDYSLKNIKVFDKDGHWLRTVGHEGEGPGEVQDARKLFIDGPRLGILQGIPAAIVWLNPDGTPSGEAVLGQAEVQGDLFLCAHAVQTGQQMFGFFSKYEERDGQMEEVSHIRQLRSDGNLGPRLYQEPEQPNPRTATGIDEGKVYDIWLRRWTGDGAGGLWVAPLRDRYVLDHVTADGLQDFRLTRDYEPLERNEAGKQDIISWFQKRGWAIEQIQVGRTAPVVQSMRTTPDGRLWVRLDQGGHDPDGPNSMVFDILDAQGRYLEQLRIEQVREAQTRNFLDEGFVLSLATDEDGEAVLCLEELCRISKQ